MTREELSKKAARDDLFFAPVTMLLGAYGALNEHLVFGAVLFLFGLLWTGLRIYDVVYPGRLFKVKE